MAHYFGIAAWRSISEIWNDCVSDIVRNEMNIIWVRCFSIKKYNFHFILNSPILLSVLLLLKNSVLLILLVTPSFQILLLLWLLECSHLRILCRSITHIHYSLQNNTFLMFFCNKLPHDMIFNFKTVMFRHCRHHFITKLQFIQVWRNDIPRIGSHLPAFSAISILDMISKPKLHHKSQLKKRSANISGTKMEHICGSLRRWT